MGTCASAIPGHEGHHYLAPHWLTVIVPNTGELKALVSGVLEPVYRGGCEANTSQESAARLLVDLPSVPHTDRDAIAFTNI